jgi:hypothetical protein
MYWSLNVIRQVKSRRMSQVGPVAGVGEEINCTRFW